MGRDFPRIRMQAAGSGHFSVFVHTARTSVTGVTNHDRPALALPQVAATSADGVAFSWRSMDAGVVCPLQAAPGHALPGRGTTAIHRHVRRPGTGTHAAGAPGHLAARGTQPEFHRRTPARTAGQRADRLHVPASAAAGGADAEHRRCSVAAGARAASQSPGPGGAAAAL